MKLLEEIKNLFKPNPRTPQTPQSPQPKQPQQQIAAVSSLKTIQHKIAGVTHYKDNILSFAFKNPQYSLSKKEMIDSDIDVLYEYNFKTGKTELIPEPTNPYDPNAIKVIIAGKHVGYIKKGSCKHILNLLNENRIAMIDSKIGGGNCKFIDFNENGNPVLEKKYLEYNVVVSITEKQK